MKFINKEIDYSRGFLTLYFESVRTFGLYKTYRKISSFGIKSKILE